MVGDKGIIEPMASLRHGYRAQLHAPQGVIGSKWRSNKELAGALYESPRLRQIECIDGRGSYPSYLVYGG
jgi:hypothetical protein